MKRTLVAGFLAAALSGCGASGGSSSPNPSTAPVQNNVLQFAVGTANLYGVANAGLNVVTTYRQPAGSTLPGGSGAVADSVALTIAGKVPGPAVGAAPNTSSDCLATGLTGPSQSEVGTSTITSDSQAAATASTPLTTFGQSGGVFATGIEPFNTQGPAANDICGGIGTTAGLPYQFSPYPVPLYDGGPGTAATLNQFVPWGGPPAFNVAGNGESIVGTANYEAGTSGTELGIDVFNGVTPLAGAYSVTVSLPTITAGTPTQTATYTLTGLTSLGTATAPIFTSDGTGGGTFALTMPTGATEALIEVVDYGPPGGTGGTVQPTGCNGAGNGLPNGVSTNPPPYYYTIEAPASMQLPDTAAPGGAQSVCAGDQIFVQVVGADYPLAEMSPFTSAGKPAPAIVGANGGTAATGSAAGTGAGDDITVSTTACEVAVSGAPATACAAGTVGVLNASKLRGAYHKR